MAFLVEAWHFVGGDIAGVEVEMSLGIRKDQRQNAAELKARH